ncbi:AcrR family transcriptional regulator [Sagittula marina]|uniref:AcrR family transcriptional regulator n=1 Tax=Sagittula marina TaxID=943940 RepID=A0A7W6DQQ2_9RHOB|nr:TetR/AcrR family transcriptional regulator [Sagittula marina]MBB3987202.1 AcrR family transcriptional regulator [Sagittula marina]
MSLREKHKSERMQRLLDAATCLFLEHGFDAVKAERIAEMADVSVGTLYNYFGGKNEILLTLTSIENERLAELGANFEPSAEASVEDNFCTLVGMHFNAQHMVLQRDLWRQGFAFAFAAPATAEARRLRQSDRVLRQQIIDLTVALQAQGRLSSDLDCEAFGATIFNNANMLFFEFTWSERSTYDDLNKVIMDMTRTIAALALPRNASA